MDPLLLHQQLKNNNQDFLDFSNDLKSWGEEMKKKDLERKPQKSQPHNNECKLQEIKKQKFEEDNRAKKEMLDDKKEVKKKCVSYADWDKFDADKECEKVDEDSDNESNSDSLVENLRDLAIIQKEDGNKFVKVGKWDEAIRSYTNAIGYYAYDPIFYANRALCFLKTKQLDFETFSYLLIRLVECSKKVSRHSEANPKKVKFSSILKLNIKHHNLFQRMEKAETDCTVALKLDNTYVKAYQRRAAARESLNRLEEARLDLLRVLELEPKNSESTKKLEELTHKTKTLVPQRPISKFSQSRQHSKRQSEIQNYSLSKETVAPPTKMAIDSNKPECIWPSGEVDNIVTAIQKPPHMRSTKPLKRIVIEEINSAIPETSQGLTENTSEALKQDQNPKVFTHINTDDIKIIEHKHPEIISTKEIRVENVNKQEGIINEKVPDLTTPRTSVQFHLIWKQLQGLDDKRSEYLRLTDPKNIPSLFKDSLESQVFSEILLVLAEHFTKERDQTYEYLLNLSKIKRFSALSMFLTSNDKNSLWKMFNHMKEYEGRSKEEIDSLISKYEL